MNQSALSRLGAACRKALLAGLVSAGCLSAAQAVPGFDAVRQGHRPSDLLLLDRHGAPLQTLRVDPTVRRLPWVALDDFSVAVRTAVVLGEDQRFLEHAGIDWQGLARSAWANAAGQGAVQGASTLSMQLAGLVDDAHARPAGGRSVPGKLAQMVAARDIEARWRKPQILEAYLNRVPLRGELVGVPAAARALFGKHASGLDAQEAALVAALIPAPNAPSARVAQRACALLQRQRLACTGIEGLAVQALRAPATNGPEGERLAPHFARQWLKGSTPEARAALRTPLDARLQRVAMTVLRQQLAELAGRNVEDGAVVVLDNANGEVLAWVGSSGSLSDAPAVDAVLARRQPGSALKPFVYGLALERRLVTPASLVEDAPMALPTGGSLYAPQNYDRRHHGWVSVRTALAASLNVPAVKVGAMLGPEAVFERLNAHGLKLSHTAGWHGHALALGSAEVTLLDLTNAYRSLANGGRWSPVRTRLAAGPVTWRTVADAGATALVSDMLADNAARSLTFGLDSALVTRGWAAVKTGTSKDLRDNWCVGYTDRFTVGVWVGNAGGAPMHQVSGTTGAAPVWRVLVQYLHAQQPARPPAAGAGAIVSAPVAGGSTELFLAGTEPWAGGAAAALRAVGQAGERQVRFGIHQPAEGSTYALDPDIPPGSQRIVLEGEAGRWLLDGRPVGQGRRVAWAPWPGWHRVRLETADGRAHERRFEVRGATVIPGHPVPRKPPPLHPAGARPELRAVTHGR